MHVEEELTRRTSIISARVFFKCLDPNVWLTKTAFVLQFLISFDSVGGSKIKTNGFRESLAFPLTLENMQIMVVAFAEINNLID